MITDERLWEVYSGEMYMRKLIYIQKWNVSYSVETYKNKMKLSSWTGCQPDTGLNWQIVPQYSSRGRARDCCMRRIYIRWSACFMRGMIELNEDIVMYRRLVDTRTTDTVKDSSTTLILGRSLVWTYLDKFTGCFSVGLLMKWMKNNTGEMWVCKRERLWTKPSKSQ